MKILAVSGGIDSVVMLDYLAHSSDEPLFVVHFDHGIRSNSHEDAKFVERLAKEYKLPFECGCAKLGADCSEAAAREARYRFLFDLAKKHSASICVAHHVDDDVIGLDDAFLDIVLAILGLDGRDVSVESLG